MTNKILFDASVHLGQFSLASEQIRIGCKNSQASISSKESATRAGFWTDNENGRVDSSVWTLGRNLQDNYYPYMDNFFSLKNIYQVQLAKDSTKKALELTDQNLGLSFVSAYTCATAITSKVSEVHTLYADLLNNSVVEFMKSDHGILILKPFSDSENMFDEEVLEKTYGVALAAFQQENVDALKSLNDDRELITP